MVSNKKIARGACGVGGRAGVVVCFGKVQGVAAGFTRQRFTYFKSALKHMSTFESAKLHTFFETCKQFFNKKGAITRLEGVVG